MSTAYEFVSLRERPEDKPSVQNFNVEEGILPPIEEGEVLVRNDYMQVTAVMADLMEEDPDLPMPPFTPGEPLWGGAVGTVLESRNENFKAGDQVSTMNGWKTHFVSGGEGLWTLAEGMFPEAYYTLCQGPTAYHGMVDIAGVREGDVVFVSGAAGGVGSLAGQIAKAKGAKRVIGSAGSQEKVDYLIHELGFDAAFNYKDGAISDQLRRAAPDGIDVFFDTVGGEQFEAAVSNAAQNARFALCGALSGQIGSAQGGFPRLDLMTAIVRQIELRPFATYHTPEQIWNWMQNYSQWLKEGKFVFPHTIVEGGVAMAPEALISLLDGKYKGNVLVKV